ncbi:MAG TPA: acyl-CoA dehydrogenase, partial [Ilumatobacteraceae bacterium]|nr:acyl-CoA dehydrogenase [Ilumatobacteraceae bacterium]
GWVLNGQKTWCTFAGMADVLMVLARSDADPKKGHRGLTIFLLEKPRFTGHEFTFEQKRVVDGKEVVGKVTARAIDTIGYRGMHSYEVALEDWWVPAENLIGEADGLGKGFYLQMQGFENGRLQTAARAVGVMQASYEAALEYANNRAVFGNNIVEYQLTQAKLGRMAVLIQSGRQFAY